MTRVLMAGGRHYSFYWYRAVLDMQQSRRGLVHNALQNEDVQQDPGAGNNLDIDSSFTTEPETRR
jgi:hypothetical protein